METVGISNFIKKQIEKNGQTKLVDISLSEIAQFAQMQLNKRNITQGYRDGVIIIKSSDYNFYKHFKCSIVKINEKTNLKCKLTKRVPNEESYIQIRALNGERLNIVGVEIILYRKDVLQETNENSTDDDWELVAFHAIPEGIENLPMKPATMMRNQLELKGGTKARYSSDQWAESIRFWQKHAFLVEE
jgi:hypothetical protein